MTSPIAAPHIRLARIARCIRGAFFILSFVSTLVLLVASCGVGGNHVGSIGKSSVTTVADAPTTTTTSPVRRVLADGEVPTSGPDLSGVSYGPLEIQRFDVYRPVEGVRAVGTIVYLHSGGWSSGTRTNIAGPIRALTRRGFAVVSADYRLTDAGASAEEILSDVDRVIRFVKARGPQLGLETSTVLLSGGSAGAHLALTATATASGDLTVASDLPDDLFDVDSSVDGVAAFVGPTDLSTLWSANDLAASSSERLLKCVVGGQKAMHGFTDACEQDHVDRYSPLALSRKAVAAGRVLPPAFLSFGGIDTLVRTDTQGRPLRGAWSLSAGFDCVVYDEPIDGGHNLDPDIDVAALEAWLNAILGA